MYLPLSITLALAASARAYWLMGAENFITTERIDPVVSPGKVASHVHSVLGGSNFRFDTNTEALRQSECTSIPIPEDKSNYWFPHLYFQSANGNFTSVNGGAVIYYLFSDKPGTTTAFPDDFRMLSGDPLLRTYDPNSYAQRAVTFLCLDFNGVTTNHNELPAKNCPSGIRAQINFPSCWDGKNMDSPDHKSHVAFPSGGPDSGTCSDPNFPVTLPRIFIEVYWATNDFDQMRSQAMNPSQPFVFANGDPTGYGYHADFLNGWDKGVLQNAVDKCHCNIYGDPTCCVDQGIFHMKKGQNCRITKSINEATTGTLSKLPGNNPVQPEGKRAVVYPDTSTPELISPVYAYTGGSPTQTGTIVEGGSQILPTSAAPASSSAPAPSSSTIHQSSPASSSVHQPVPSSSSPAPSSSATPQTSAAQGSSVQSPAPTPSTTSYVHTTPATTTTKYLFPTFSTPTISIPTFSFPFLNNGSPNVNKGGDAPYGNYFQSKPASSTSAPTPTSTAISSSGTKGRCTKRSKRSLFVEELEVMASRDVADTPVRPVVNVQNVDRARRSHRRRFTNHFTN